jgi:hypothetical protein
MLGNHGLVTLAMLGGIVLRPRGGGPKGPGSPGP